MLLDIDISTRLRSNADKRGRERKTFGVFVELRTEKYRMRSCAPESWRVAPQKWEEGLFTVEKTSQCRNLPKVQVLEVSSSTAISADMMSIF